MAYKLLLPRLQLVYQQRGADLVSQVGTGLAHLSDDKRAVFDLLEHALRLLAVVRGDFPEFVDHRDRIAGHRLALFDPLEKLSPYRFNLFCRHLIFANDGLSRQLADLSGAVPMLDIIWHCQVRRAHRWL